MHVAENVCMTLYYIMHPFMVNFDLYNGINSCPKIYFWTRVFILKISINQYDFVCFPLMGISNYTNFDVIVMSFVSWYSNSI